MSTTQPAINRYYAEATNTLDGNQDQITFYHGLKENNVPVASDFCDIVFTSVSLGAANIVGGTPVASLVALTTTTATFIVRGMRSGDTCTYKCIAFKAFAGGKVVHAGKLTGTDLGTTAGSANVDSATGGFNTYVKAGDVFVIDEPGSGTTTDNGVYTVASIMNDTTLTLTAPLAATTANLNFTIEGPSATPIASAATFIQIPFHLPGDNAYAGGAVTNIDAEFPGTDINTAEIADGAVTNAKLANTTLVDANFDTVAPMAVSKLNPDLTNAALGAAAAYVVYAGAVAVTGTQAVATGLTSIEAATHTLRLDPAIATDMWTSHTIAGGTVTLKTWKPTAAANVAPVAGTGGPNIDYIFVGTA